MELLQDIIQAIGLGIIQGLTEFLPISSTAHLKVLPVALGWGDPGVSLTAAIQLGSIVAVVQYFWQDLAQITRGGLLAMRQRQYDTLEWRLAVGIALGTVPIVVAGVLLKVLVPDLDNSPLRSMTAIAIASIAMSLLLALAETQGRRSRGFSGLRVADGLWIGVAQTLALVPGVSRSGSTLTAALFVGLDRVTAARFSFLLGIPAITLAGVVELKELFARGFGPEGPVFLLVSLVSSAVFSYLAIAGLLKFFQTQSAWVFVWYRLGFGTAILAAVASGWFK